MSCWEENEDLCAECLVLGSVHPWVFSMSIQLHSNLQLPGSKEFLLPNNHKRSGLEGQRSRAKGTGAERIPSDVRKARKGVWGIRKEVGPGAQTCNKIWLRPVYESPRKCVTPLHRPSQMLHTIGIYKNSDFPLYPDYIHCLCCLGFSFLF
jgi:hypothetical protein